MIIQAEKLFLPADSYYQEDICGSCGHSYVKRGANFYSCPEKKCRCNCKDNEEQECLVHWRCNCEKQQLCEYHTKRPDLVTLRYTARRKEGGKWLRTAMKDLLAKARPLVARQKKARLRAWSSHCGFCFARMPKTVLKDTCPNGCKCNCKSKSDCLVHFRCSCSSGSEYPCYHHREKRPDIIAWVWSQLPEPDRSWLSNQLKAAQIQPEIHLAKSNARKSKRPFPSEKVISSKPKVKTKQTKKRPFQKYYSDYVLWLAKQPLSEHSKRNYSSRIKVLMQFLLEERFEEYEDLTASNKDEIARDFKKYLKQQIKTKPATTNSYIAGMNNFFGFRAIGPTSVQPDVLAKEAPRSLTKLEQKKLLKAIDKTKRIKDKAVMLVLFYTGVRISECMKLELDDVFVVGRKTRLVVRSGKGDKYREIPLNSRLCEVLQAWLAERSKKHTATSNAFFVNAQGEQMSTAAIDKIVRKIGQDCGLEISAHIMRHTLLTNLLRNQNDVVLVADVAGHSNLKTTQRYTLPSAADKAKALEALLDL